VKVAGRWRYVYRAVDQEGQVIDVLVSARRDLAAAPRLFAGAITAHGRAEEVVTDLAQALETAVEELLADAFHDTGQYANHRVELSFPRFSGPVGCGIGAVGQGTDGRV